MLKKLHNWVNLKQYNTALLVIDIQKDFCSPDGKAGKRGKSLTMIQSIIPKLDKFIKRLSDKGILVIFTKFISGSEVTPNNLKTAIDKNGFDLVCVKASGGEELYSIAVPSKAIIIDKPHYDSLAYTQINQIFKEKNIENVLITGVRTELCVDTTAKRVASEGYNSIIISDLVATYDDRRLIHKEVLDFFDKYFGFVIISDEILDQFI